MDPKDLAALPLAIQTALGGGYLAYVISYAGLRAHHNAQDAIFLTFAFGLLPGLVVATVGERSLILATGLALIAAVCLGVLWRRWGRAWSHRAFRWGRVHTDDGLGTAWSALIHTTRPMAQIDVHLTNGNVLRCTDLHRYRSAHLGGTLLGSDGSVVMVVEIEDINGQRHDAQNIVHQPSGTRLTYIPAGQVARVDLRVEGVPTSSRPAAEEAGAGASRPPK